MQRDLKVLFFSPIYPTGGISTFTLNILDYVRKENISNFIFTDASIYYKKVGQPSKVRRLYSGILDTLRLLISYTRAIQNNRPDVVHINTSASWALCKDYIYLHIAKHFNCKVVFHYHFGRIPELNKKKNWEWKLLLYNINKSKHSIVIDPLSKKILNDNGLNDKVSYIPNPCSIKLERIAHDNIKDNKNDDSYIFVGHVIASKGVYELVQAFTSISIPLKLMLIGLVSDHVKEELMNIAVKKDNGSWLSIVGNQTLDYVYNKMEFAKALLLPSYTEGFPNVVLEAMACGCPVIASSVGAIPDMLSIDDINNACGICIPPYSKEGIKDAILSFEKDELNQYKLGINGKKKIISAYTIEKIFNDYKQIWRL